MRMHFVAVLGFALAACAENAPTAARLASSRGMLAAQSSDAAVTSVINDADTSIAAALQFRSDGLGPYKNSKSLTSVNQSIGAWLLDMLNPPGATRQVYLDFSQPIAGSGPNGGNPVAVPSGLYRVRMIAKCNLYGVTMQGLAPGASMACPLHTGFNYGGSSYAVQMNPLVNAAGDTSAPETNTVTVTCTVPASGAGPCTHWRITPSGTFVDGGGVTRYQNVGKLFKYVTIKGTNTPVNQGDFDFSFSIDVNNP